MGIEPGEQAADGVFEKLAVGHRLNVFLFHPLEDGGEDAQLFQGQLLFLVTAGRLFAGADADDGPRQQHRQQQTNPGSLHDDLVLLPPRWGLRRHQRTGFTALPW